MALYGDDKNHLELRGYVAQYLEVQKSFFSQFMTESFGTYLKKLQTDGHWADNIEIQAIAEMYDVRVEIFTTSRIPIKVFNDKPQTIKFPLRLFYLQQCHYELIWDPRRVPPLKEHVFGLAEKAAVEEGSRPQGSSNSLSDSRSPFQQLCSFYFDADKQEVLQAAKNSLLSLETDFLRTQTEVAAQQEREMLEEAMLRIAREESMKDVGAGFDIPEEIGFGVETAAFDFTRFVAPVCSGVNNGQKQMNKKDIKMALVMLGYGVNEINKAMAEVKSPKPTLEEVKKQLEKHKPS